MPFHKKRRIKKQQKIMLPDLFILLLKLLPDESPPEKTNQKTTLVWPAHTQQPPATASCGIESPGFPSAKTSANLRPNGEVRLLHPAAQSST